MKTVFFISRRLSARSGLATLSVATSIVVMLLGLMISNGFRHEIQDSVFSSWGNMAVMSPYMDLMSEKHFVKAGQGQLDCIRASSKGIEDVSAVIYRAGVLKSQEGVSGVMFKGVDSLYDFAPLEGRLCEGEFPDYSAEGISTEALIPYRIAKESGLGTGDSFMAYFIGDEVKARRFRITGIYRSLSGEDGSFIFADIGNLRRLNAWEPDAVSAIEIFLKKGADEEEAFNAVSQAIYECYDTEDPSAIVYATRNRFPSVFDWLGLLDFNLYAILLLMFVVSGFNMVSGLLIILFENISTIGILKTMGMRNASIAKTFVAKASSIVLKGMLAGNAVALALAAIQNGTGIIRLNLENYIVETMPVAFSWGGILLLDAIAYIAIMAVLLIPCMFISRVDAAKSVKML